MMSDFNPEIDEEVKPRKQDANVQLSKRFAKALKIKDSVTFTTPETAWIPSISSPEELHQVHFGEKQYCNDCYSFTSGYSSDPNFECYHIIAAKLKWEEITTPATVEAKLKQ